MKQMAMEVGKTSGAVRTKLHRLRRSLRDCVQNHLREKKYE
jgi:DNA-directed RNA polymerase specialized sigma24 family protein